MMNRLSDAGFNADSAEDAVLLFEGNEEKVYLSHHTVNPAQQQ